MKVQKLAVWLTAIVVATGVIGAFFLVGSPAANRAVQFDDYRVRDLRSIQSQVFSYYKTTGGVPETLTDLDDDFDYFTLPTDPETGSQYRYRVIDQEAFEFQLCATFSAKSLEIGPEGTPRQKAIYYVDELDQDWTHAKGEECFVRKINPERHPVRDVEAEI